MPPTLDLSSRATHKSIISPPRINLRKAASYNHDRGPLSSTSSRFNFNHLVFSPPPSPGLPSLSPPPRKPSRGFAGLVRPSRVIRYTFWLLSTLFIFFVVRCIKTTLTSDDETLASSSLLRGPEITLLPETAAPIMVRDKRGRAEWTVSIPPTEDFPLPIAQYAALCTQCAEVSAQVRSLRAKEAYLGFAPDPTSGFIDVREAKHAGHLPTPPDDDRKKREHPVVCDRTLTFVLESDDAGLGAALMSLWTAYGVAEKEGRAFFVEDARWAYGKYADIFRAPPNPGCAPPPRAEMLPCPREARHLVATAATARLLVTPGDPDGGGGDVKSDFALARRGYEALFHLNSDDAAYVDARARELVARRIAPRSKGTANGVVVGVHVRRGDRHPRAFQFQDSYVPLDVYAETAQAVVAERGGAPGQSFVVLASDDPTVYEAGEFGGAATPAQERIKLGGKQVGQRPSVDRHVMRKFVDETFGWEGGFFAAMFWNLGVATTSAGGERGRGGGEATRLRSLVGRAYMMDLAVLADSSDAVVCTASAVGCRLLAVMMGWGSAMERGDWRNIDGGMGWVGVTG
ncbi:hypothetical protein QBC39DRAFT_412110 [Podospora conica]|nr:hypothetical protein QBC39DRAFT_412110 [Schizothecium conicum]